MHRDDGSAIRQREQAQLDVAHPSAAFDKTRMHRVGSRDQLGLRVFDGSDRMIGISHAANVHLPGQEALGM